MPEESLDERYLTWLYGQVASVKTRARKSTHWSLLRKLHQTIFVAHVAHDENRCADAKDLRYEFLAECEDVQGDPDWTRFPCTMLELMIVLARQLAFEMDEDVSPWFWHMIDVLELHQFNDRDYNQDAEEVIESVLDRVIWRNYEPDGRGGFFPLRNPTRDQRKVELWYQLNAYLLEQF